MGNIKSFKDFNLSNSEEINEGWLSNIVDSAGDAFVDVIKGKASAYLLGFFGISEQSIFSKFIQNFVEQIPLSDMTKIIFAGKANSAYLAPKLADATIEFLTEKGLDGIAEDLKIEPTGWIYRTISEMLSNKSRREDFRESLVGFYLQAFRGFKGVDADDFKKSLSPTEAKVLGKGIDKIAKSQGQKIEMPTEGSKKDIISNFLSGLVGGGQSLQSLGLSTGETLK